MSEGAFFCKFSASPGKETTSIRSRGAKNGTDLLYHHAVVLSGAGTLRSARGGGKVRFCVFLSVKLWTTEILSTSQSRRWNVCNFGINGYGKVYSCAPHSNFVITPLDGAITECWSWKYSQIRGFSPLKDDIISWSRWHSACECIVRSTLAC